MIFIRCCWQRARWGRRGTVSWRRERRRPTDEEETVETSSSSPTSFFTSHRKWWWPRHWQRRRPQIFYINLVDYRQFSALYVMMVITRWFCLCFATVVEITCPQNFAHRFYHLRSQRLIAYIHFCYVSTVLNWLNHSNYTHYYGKSVSFLTPPLHSFRFRWLVSIFVTLWSDEEGSLPFPSVSDLNTRFRRVITSFQRSHKQGLMKLEQISKVIHSFDSCNLCT